MDMKAGDNNETRPDANAKPAIEKKKQMGRGSYGIWEPRRVLFWACLSVGILLALLLRWTISIEKPEETDAFVEFKGPVDVFIRLMISYKGVSSCCTELLANDMDEDAILDAQKQIRLDKRGLRSLDLSGVFDPHYSARIRETRSGMIAEWEKLAGDLGKAAENPAYLSLPENSCEQAMYNAGAALQQVVRTLNIDRWEFEQSIEALRTRPDTGKEMTEEEREKRNRDFEALMFTFETVTGLEGSP